MSSTRPRARRALHPIERADLAIADAAALDGIAIGSEELNSDIHASAEYRAHCLKVLLTRAVTAIS